MERAQQTCELWAQTYPRDWKAHGFLAGIVYPVLGKYEQSVEEGKKTIELNPDFAIAYVTLSLGYRSLDRLAEAENMLQRASERKLDVPSMSLERYGIAFLRGDRAELARLGDPGVARSGTEDLMSNYQAFALGYGGQLQGATREVAAGGGPGAAGCPLGTGGALPGRPPRSGKRCSERPRRAPERSRCSESVDGTRGAVWCGVGAGGSPAMFAALRNSRMNCEKGFPENTAVRFNYLPTIRARLALTQGDPGKALELLRTAAHYELGWPPSASVGSFGALYPVYVRGEAYLAAHRGTEAAAEFLKVLNHRGIVGADPIGALARLQLGRAFTLAGDRPKAIAAYQDFLALWEHADPDVPVLTQAKAEYARLR